MSDTRPEGTRRVWLTVGEVVAVAALAIAALNYWESHQERLAEARRVSLDAQAQAALVMRGEVIDGGRALALAPIRSEQVISSERYVFPRAVLADPVSLSATRPEILVAWLAPRLRETLGGSRLRKPGHIGLPLVIETSYVEGGEPRSDSTLYVLGVAWRPRWLTGPHFTLTGLALVRRSITGDPSKAADAAWRPASSGSETKAS